MSVKTRALAALSLLPSEGKLLRLSKRVIVAIDSWKVRLAEDPTLSDLAMEELLPLVSSPKQVFLDYLKRVRSENRVKRPTMKEITERVGDLMRGTVRDMWPIQADEQTMHQMKLLLDDGLSRMITEHFIYNGGVDTIQIVGGELRANINIVPVQAIEWLTIKFDVSPQGVTLQNWEENNLDDVL